jgi:hypothetical protein
MSVLRSRFFVLLCCAGIFLPVVLTCATGGPRTADEPQVAAPGWVIDKNIDYPPDRYIAEVREGDSRADAEAFAIGGISLFFKTTANVKTDARREYNELIANQNAAEWSQKSYLNESSEITSDVEFLGVHTESYEHRADKNKTLWYSLAYIDRAEAAKIYDGKIKANLSAINAIENDAKGEDEDFFACTLYHQTLPIIAITTEYINMARAVDGKPDKYANELNYFGGLQNEYRKLRAVITFTVTANENKFSGKIERAVQDVLESNNFKVGGLGAYNVKLEISSEEVVLPAGMFILSSLVIKMIHGERALMSYSKNYPRSGGTTTAVQSYNITANMIEKDLKQEFNSQIQVLLGKE